MKTIKQTLKVVGLVLIAIFCFIGVGETMIELFGTNRTERQLKNCKTELNAYQNYYYSVETLLDSMGVDVDSPYLETDAGSSYLDAKMHLDSIYCANNYGSHLTQKIIKDKRVK